MRRAARWLTEYFDQIWIKFFVGPVLLAVPPGLLTAYFAKASLHVEFVQVLPGGLVRLLDAHPLEALTVALAWVPILTLLRATVQHVAKSYALPVQGVVYLLDVLDRVVDAKAQRFGNFAKAVVNGQKKGKAAVFSEITQPEQQIALMPGALHAFLDSIDATRTTFQVGVLAIEEGIPVDWVHFWPANDFPRTDIQALQSDESAICRCVRDRTIQIIEDVRAESRKPKSSRRLVPGVEGDEEGSLICYPVYHAPTASIPYAISVFAKTKGYFREDRKPLYEMVLRRFSGRIALEYSLLIIKNGMSKNGGTRNEKSDRGETKERVGEQS